MGTPFPGGKTDESDTSHSPEFSIIGGGLDLYFYEKFKAYSTCCTNPLYCFYIPNDLKLLTVISRSVLELVHINLAEPVP
jgi:hypothetical protein